MGKKKSLSVLMGLALFVTGCSYPVPSDSMPEENTVTEQITVTESEKTTVTETSKESEPLTFNPHVYCGLLSSICTEDHWNSLYNLCDAIRAGEDTFECAGEDVYKWCTDDTVIGSFLPVSCTLVKPDGYEDGIGRIKYMMDKDEFLAREQAFEDEVCRILNEAVRSDYSDFEKCMGLYDYMTENFQYDYSDIDGQGVDDFSTYACLMSKKGICCEMAGAYSYLLLQCGVEAMVYGGDGSAGYHDWVYVILDGKGYHVDPTWALYGGDEYGVLSLTYFMETDEERISDGFDREAFEADWIWYWNTGYDRSMFPAVDGRFSVLHDWATFRSMDTERNVITCISSDGDEFEFSYGDL